MDGSGNLDWQLAETLQREEDEFGNGIVIAFWRIINNPAIDVRELHDILHAQARRSNQRRRTGVVQEDKAQEAAFVRSPQLVFQRLNPANQSRQFNYQPEMALNNQQLERFIRQTFNAAPQVAPRNPNAIDNEDIHRKIDLFIGLELNKEGIFRDNLNKLELKVRLEYVEYLLSKYEQQEGFKVNVQLEQRIEAIDDMGIFKPLDQAIKKIANKNQAEIKEETRVIIRRIYVEKLKELKVELNQLAKPQAQEIKAEEKKNEQPRSTPAATVMQNPLRSPGPSAPPLPVAMPVPSVPAFSAVYYSRPSPSAPSLPLPPALPNPASMRPAVRPAPAASVRSDDFRNAVNSVREMARELRKEIAVLEEKKKKQYFTFFTRFEIRSKTEKERAVTGLNTRGSLEDLQRDAAKALQDSKVTWRFFNTSTGAIGVSRTKNLMRKICDIRLGNESDQAHDERIKRLRK